jgi:predicted DNA repair protein MutK
LALNAQQVSGVDARHELPVVWAVFKGSTINKCILVPAALAIGAFAPWLVTPLLMVGGLYLCYEGVEKLAHKFLHGGDAAAHAAKLPGDAGRTAPSDHEIDRKAAAKAAHLQASKQAAAGETMALGAPEKQKIKGAIRTDFILSAEIIAITLGTVAGQPFVTQLTVMVGIAAIMTIGVYGLVAGIVKLDDAGLYLSQRTGTGVAAQLSRKTGFGILAAAPYLMKTLSVVGTVAMFLVGGGILTHGVAAAHHWIEGATAEATALPGVGAFLGAVTPMLLNGLAGIVAGALTLMVVMLATKTIGSLRNGKTGAAS